MKKRIGIVFLLTVFVASFFPPESSAAPTVSASSVCLMDAKTGEVLFEKNMKEERGMASTTKIMTAIVALEHGNLDDTVTVSANAANTEGSSIWLSQGEQIKLSDLLYGLMLASGNDSAVAIAEHIGGSVDEFVRLMNEKAKEIGAEHTSFANSNGLTADGHYTTAYDLALITRYAMQNNTFREIVSTWQTTIPHEGAEWDRSLTNHNKLLNLYDGCIGVKTGFTKAAGRCLVSAAERDGVILICVTLNDPDDWNDHIHLMDDGFSQYESTVLAEKGQILSSIKIPESTETMDVMVSETLSLPIRTAQASLLKSEIQIHELHLPVAVGDPVGDMVFFIEDKEIGRVPLLSTQAIDAPPQSGFWVNFNYILNIFFSR